MVKNKESKLTEEDLNNLTELYLLLEKVDERLKKAGSVDGIKLNGKMYENKEKR